MAFHGRDLASCAMMGKTLRERTPTAADKEQSVRSGIGCLSVEKAAQTNWPTDTATYCITISWSFRREPSSVGIIKTYRTTPRTFIVHVYPLHRKQCRATRIRSKDNYWAWRNPSLDFILWIDYVDINVDIRLGIRECVCVWTFSSFLWHFIHKVWIWESLRIVL